MQCDEQKPACTNCRNHDIDCTFSAADTRSTDGTPPPRNYRFRSYDFTFDNKRKHKAKASSTTDQHRDSPTETQPQPPGAISYPDLQLFHNFVIETYRTLADTPEAENVWQRHIVQWGIAFPSILHLILAISALHLGHENPALRDQYVQQAGDHFTFGVRSVTSILNQLNEDNCQKVYISAVLICFIYFARRPHAGEYLIFSDDGPGEWQALMHGVKLIVQSYREKVFSGVLKPESGLEDGTIDSVSQSEMNEYTVHVDAVQSLVEKEIAESDRGIYDAGIQDLLSVMRAVYMKRSSQIRATGFMQVLIGWLYRLPEEMVSLLEQKEPVALIILAHWGMLLKYMRSVWFMEGWDGHIVSGVRSALPANLQHWIEWLEKKVEKEE
ncbi:C6 finger domain protein [Penicillium riverlandense]|uniref:C6 finger domain protein n=1 Tax=Penicillium riverlandense TaxID=1903569 RepID=UPI0025468226|nr:C6 finger domain protein [Penicillium riverlandense]KAJ5814714.1 C6 finger domain protein [Penicillium riverlandense]